MLWVGMASIVMAFAGLTSGYIVSRSSLMAENRWLKFALPHEFHLATIAVVVSSISIMWGKSARKKGSQSSLRVGLMVTLAFGLAFAFLQFLGWKNMVDQGLFFTGPESNTAASWVYVITLLHWLHIIAGLIVVIVTLYQENTGAYKKNDHQGFDLAATFWHFLAGLWLYLLLFMAFIR